MKKSFMVSYDLIKRKDYPELWNALGAYTPSWHCLGSTWIIKSDKSAPEIRNELLKHIDGDDKLIIVNLLQREAAWTTSFNQQCQDWLRNNLFP